jgi:hypothetical protein
MSWKSSLLAAALILVTLSARAQTHTTHPVLVELFTSEGCSSCPPADALLRSLSGTVTPGGQQIIALSEHVAYWNRLGWIDPFSAQMFSDRQDYYGDNLRLDEIFTPQIIVNGTQSALGNDRAAVLAAIDTQSQPLPVSISIRSATAGPHGISVLYLVTGDAPPAGTEIWVALTEDEVTVPVARGENAGRTLTHADVVRSLQLSTLLPPGESTNIMLPTPMAARGQSSGGRHVVVFAQAAGQGRVLGIAMAAVDPAFPTEPAQRDRTLVSRR